MVLITNKILINTKLYLPLSSTASLPKLIFRKICKLYSPILPKYVM